MNTPKQDEEKENEALALRYHNEIFQKGKLEVADDILSSDFVIHNPVLPEVVRNGPEGTEICICGNNSSTRSKT
jgi:predicted SnoaL-like aldol condensation-catalyzing enzyme